MSEITFVARIHNNSLGSCVGPITWDEGVEIIKNWCEEQGFELTPENEAGIEETGEVSFIQYEDDKPEFYTFSMGILNDGEEDEEEHDLQAALDNPEGWHEDFEDEANAHLEVQPYKDVHTEHCCAEYGCKYNDKECPVWLGYRKQSYGYWDGDKTYPIPKITEEEFEKRRADV